MCVSFTQWLLKPSYQVPRYQYRMLADYERPPQSLQTRIWPSEYWFENMTLCQSCVQFCRLVHQSRRFCLCCIVKEDEVMGTVLTILAAADVVATYEWILGALQTCPFLD
ncbi:hypothetical protein TNCV_3758181 [Trichonephila clavipes]|nr:hypothetical protein TNCV_3758181 [Trichonephila clavipes]